MIELLTLRNIKNRFNAVNINRIDIYILKKNLCLNIKSMAFFPNIYLFSNPPVKEQIDTTIRVMLT